MQKATKIVATIGPASDSEAIIAELIHSGMNVARFNTKHGTPDWHLERMKRVRRIATELKRPIGILLDLQGPEIRIDIPGEAKFEVNHGDEVIFTSNEKSENPHQPIIPQIVIESLSPGNNILIDDGLGEFEVVSRHKDRLHTKVLGNFYISHRKTLNTPGVVIDLPSLIDQDLVHLKNANNDLVDFIGLSFVRNAHDIAILRKEMKKHGLTADVVAKIENQSAIDNLDEVIEAADAVMVARGDLAVEVPFRELTYWQKMIIIKCRQAAKPVITATQMLKSMVEQPRPTRAEVSDVAHAIYDGTDAIMLSEETTIGKFPVESVATQATIAEFNEQFAEFPEIHAKGSSIARYVCKAAIEMVEECHSNKELKIATIVCLTETGATARYISRSRPKVKIFALTSNLQTFRKLSLVNNVEAHVINLPDNNRLEGSEKLLEKMKKLDIAKSGDTILLVHGTFWKEPGLTNTVSLLQIP